MTDSSLVMCQSFILRKHRLFIHCKLRFSWSTFIEPTTDVQKRSLSYVPSLSLNVSLRCTSQYRSKDLSLLCLILTLVAVSQFTVYCLNTFLVSFLMIYWCFCLSSSNHFPFSLQLFQSFFIWTIHSQILTAVIKLSRVTSLMDIWDYYLYWPHVIFVTVSLQGLCHLLLKQSTHRNINTITIFGKLSVLTTHIAHELIFTSIWPKQQQHW